MNDYLLMVIFGIVGGCREQEQQVIIHSFIHSFIIKGLLRLYHASGTVLSAGYTVMNSTDRLRDFFLKND